MTEKACKRCSACCQVLPLFTQHMHPKYREYLLNRGLVEDKQQGCILIPHVCQHLKLVEGPNKWDAVKGIIPCKTVYACDIHDDPDRPEVCRKFHGQRMMKGARVYIPHGCSFREDP